MVLIIFISGKKVLTSMYTNGILMTYLVYPQYTLVTTSVMLILKGGPIHGEFNKKRKRKASTGG